MSLITKGKKALNWAFMMERGKGIEPASRTWELLDMGRIEPLSSGFG